MSHRQTSTRCIHGWLFDAYPTPGGMTVWFITEQDERILLNDDFRPSFYFNGPPAAVEAAIRMLSRETTPISIRRVDRVELMKGEAIPVVEARFTDPTRPERTAKKLARVIPRLNLYNCDIPAAQLYFYERRVFPLAFCEIQPGENGDIFSIRALDSPWDPDSRPPPLRSLALRLEGEMINPGHAQSGRIEIHDDGEISILEGDDPVEMLESLNGHLHRKDPDLVFTDWGDSFIIPRLLQLSGRTGIPLALNRDNRLPVAGRRSRSYASYGRTVHTAGARTFFGRWHIDRKNSFILSEADLAGLLEQSRVTKLPVQHAARTSTGTGITSMQLETAYSDGILIPWRKSEPEAFKSGLELLTIDKGGLVFVPPAGFHEEVAELDFASMYPSIMVHYNISPETVGCACCPNNRAPETDYPVCARRRGLVPKTLAPILAKRADYKQRMKSTSDPVLKKIYDRRQTALKWLLVVSFGYLGYKNARFGRIEAHECVTAYSREILLRAKEIAEEAGFRFLHAIVDSLWVKKPGASDADYAELVREISRRTGFPIGLEGIYRWISFPPSRSRPGLAVPSRYWGVFRSGDMKIRGLEVRRSDTPPLIKNVQRRMMDILGRAKNRMEFYEMIPEALAILSEARGRLAGGRVRLAELVISRTLSREPREYRKANLSAIAAHELISRGVSLRAGETIQYIITNASDKDPAGRVRAYAAITADHSYDIEKYTELLVRSGEDLLSPFGYSADVLDRLIRPGRGGTENFKIVKTGFPVIL